MEQMLRSTKVFWKRNGSTILSTAGAIGVVTTTIMAVKATLKPYTRYEKTVIIC